MLRKAALKRERLDQMKREEEDELGGTVRLSKRKYRELLD